jgi:hypothetical protein
MGTINNINNNPACLPQIGGPQPPNLWSRATNTNCINGYSPTELNMRRKAEVLKYKGNENKLTKKQQWSRIINGNGPLGKKTWASQNDLGSNPNIYGLTPTTSGNGTSLNLCAPTEATSSSIKCSPSTASDVPGPEVLLCYDPSVPLVGYGNPRRTYLAGGTKFPQMKFR